MPRSSSAVADIPLAAPFRHHALECLSFLGTGLPVARRDNAGAASASTNVLPVNQLNNHLCCPPLWIPACAHGQRTASIPASRQQRNGKPRVIHVKSSPSKPTAFASVCRAPPWTPWSGGVTISRGQEHDGEWHEGRDARRQSHYGPGGDASRSIGQLLQRHQKA